MTGNENTRTATEAELMRLVVSYARAMDQNEPDILNDILTEDIVLMGPGFSITGLAGVLAVPQALREQYSATRHLVYNQTVMLDGDTAKGETYSTASHLIKTDSDSKEVLNWEIRYQDQFRLCGGRWRIARRELVVDWTETRPISCLPA